MPRDFTELLRYLLSMIVSRVPSRWSVGNMTRALQRSTLAYLRLTRQENS